MQYNIPNHEPRHGNKKYKVNTTCPGREEDNTIFGGCRRIPWTLATAATEAILKSTPVDMIPVVVGDNYDFNMFELRWIEQAMSDVRQPNNHFEILNLTIPTINDLKSVMIKHGMEDLSLIVKLDSSIWVRGDHKKLVKQLGIYLDKELEYVLHDKTDEQVIIGFKDITYVQAFLDKLLKYTHYYKVPCGYKSSKRYLEAIKNI